MGGSEKGSEAPNIRPVAMVTIILFLFLLRFLQLLVTQSGTQYWLVLQLHH